MLIKNCITLFLFSQARLGHTRSLGARRGSAVVSMPGDHYQMDLHVLERDPTGIRILVYCFPFFFFGFSNLQYYVVQILFSFSHTFTMVVGSRSFFFNFLILVQS